MFKSLKKKERETALQMLAFIVIGTQSSAGLALVPTSEANKMHKAEPTLIEVGTAVGSNSQVRATAAGIAAISTQASTQVAAQPESTDNTLEFVLEDGIELPPTIRGGNKGNKYPFASMQPGQSFFIAATEAKPNPAKALASTVSSATKRYPADPAVDANGKKVFTRKYTVRARTQEKHGEVGARVWRSY